jgi:hypothetical protein
MTRGAIGFSLRGVTLRMGTSIQDVSVFSNVLERFSLPITAGLLISLFLKTAFDGEDTVTLYL